MLCNNLDYLYSSQNWQRKWITINSLSFTQSLEKARTQDLSLNSFTLNFQGGSNRIPRAVKPGLTDFTVYPSSWLYSVLSLSLYPLLSPHQQNISPPFQNHAPPLPKLSPLLPWRFEVWIKEKLVPSAEKIPLRRLNRVPNRFFGFKSSSSLQRYSKLVFARSINSMSSFESPLVEYLLTTPSRHS